MMSGPFTPAAATLINTSPEAGEGTGRFALTSTPGPPGFDISTTSISPGMAFIAFPPAGGSRQPTLCSAKSRNRLIRLDHMVSQRRDNRDGRGDGGKSCDIRLAPTVPHNLRLALDLGSTGRMIFAHGSGVSRVPGSSRPVSDPVVQPLRRSHLIE